MKTFFNETARSERIVSHGWTVRTKFLYVLVMNYIYIIYIGTSNTIKCSLYYYIYSNLSQTIFSWFFCSVFCIDIKSRNLPKRPILLRYQSISYIMFILYWYTAIRRIRFLTSHIIYTMCMRTYCSLCCIILHNTHHHWISNEILKPREILQIFILYRYRYISIGMKLKL